MEDLRDFGSELTKNTPPRIGTSHGGLRDFGFQLTKNVPPPPNFELFMENSDGNNSAAANTNSNFAHLL